MLIKHVCGCFSSDEEVPVKGKKKGVKVKAKKQKSNSDVDSESGMVICRLQSKDERTEIQFFV